MKTWIRFVPFLAALGLVALTWSLYVNGFPADALVVYCAHDSIYSEAVLQKFSRDTGIPVKIKFDTEATKSLALVELLVREKERPRCDVFWNNELLGMLRLKKQGVLEPFASSARARIPGRFKDAEGFWTGFAARARIYIINTKSLVGQDPADYSIEAMERAELFRTVMAKPLYGTTLTHYCVLWERLGAENLKAWHADVRRRGMKEVNGNSMVKELVANGACDLGFTDTDDFFVAKDSGSSVSMAPVRLEDGSTICIPNTVAIVAGTSRPVEARRLVDFLLSAETEIALANSSSRQIPLGELEEQSDAKLPAEVKAMRPWIVDAVDLGGLEPASEACIDWLKGLDGEAP